MPRTVTGHRAWLLLRAGLVIVSAVVLSGCIVYPDGGGYYGGYARPHPYSYGYAGYGDGYERHGWR